MSALNAAFPVKNLGELSWFMGSHYERDRTNGTITVSQTRFIKSMLSKFESLVEVGPHSQRERPLTLDH